MTLDLTSTAQAQADSVQKTPQLVFSIEGVPTKYGALRIQKRIRIGDPELYIGTDWKIGGLRDILDQLDVISFQQGTSTSITQQLQPDKGEASSVSTMQIALIDRSQAITRLITPGEIVSDVLGRRCKVELGFDGTSYPEDFITIFRGVVDDIQAGPGLVILNISHPDQKKRQQVFQKIETKLDAVVSNIGGVSTITVESTSDFLTPVTGPNGLIDPDFKTYCRINDEIFRYTGKTATTLTGVTRAQIGTVNGSHAIDDNVESFYVLEGNVIDLSLKLMLSGFQGYFKTGVDVTSFVQISVSESVANCIYFEGVDLFNDYGLTVGDYITTTSATNGANNVTLKQILEIERTDLGSYAVIDGVSFVSEPSSPATISFRSQYDVWPDGAGFKMYPDEVDVTEHLRLQNLFLSGVDYRFYLTDTVEGRDFLTQEIYAPCGAYTLPRKAQSSIGFHSGPIPGSKIPILTEDNIQKPSTLKVRRSIIRNFANTIVTKFDESALDAGKFLSGVVNISSTSKNQIQVGTRSLEIKSKGLRTDLQAVSVSTNANNRKLNRYKFGAEYIERMKCNYGSGITIEVGDIVMLDGDGLHLYNSKEADRDFAPRLFEVTNKTLKFTGEVELTLVDTNFANQSRYGLISPSSVIKSGQSSTQFTIERSYGGALYGKDEFKKWNRYKDCYVIIRDAGWSTVSSPVKLESFVGNSVTVASTIGFTPSAGMIMELAKYSYQGDQIKLLFAFMYDGATFPDGGFQYVIL